MVDGTKVAVCPTPLIIADDNPVHLGVIQAAQSEFGCAARYEDAPCLGTFVAIARPDGSYAYKVNCIGKEVPDA